MKKMTFIFSHLSYSLSIIIEYSLNALSSSLRTKTQVYIDIDGRAPPLLYFFVVSQRQISCNPCSCNRVEILSLGK